MRKRNIFLILLGAIILLSGKNVHAQETRFYEAEYVNGIYVTESPGPTRQTYRYKMLKFVREDGTNRPAYCIEPQRDFDRNADYNYWENYRDFTKEQMERIKALAHFGYQYRNHTDNKWYAITQILIWRTADPQGLYYFTEYLDGPEVTPYNNEINELNTMVDNYLRRPSLPNKVQASESIELNDINNVLNNYNTSLGRIENNKLIIDNNVEGDQTITLTRKDNYFNEPIIFFQSNYSQDLINYGDFEINEKVSLKIISTKITIHKVDAGTKEFEEPLINTKYRIIDSNKEEIGIFQVDATGTIEKKYLPYGTYYIQEIETDSSYQLDTELHEITISEETPTIELTLENKIIEKNIIIHKTFGEEDNFQGEADVTFEIYNNEDLIGTYTTNEDGYINITLPYGEYELRQVNTKDGYRMLDPITLLVIDTEEVTYELKDYKIPVPNTKTNLSIPVPNTNTNWSILDLLVCLIRCLRLS